jgi:hypothetical protein
LNANKLIGVKIFNQAIKALRQKIEEEMRTLLFLTHFCKLLKKHHSNPRISKIFNSTNFCSYLHIFLAYFSHLFSSSTAMSRNSQLDKSSMNPGFQMMRSSLSGSRFYNSRVSTIGGGAAGSFRSSRVGK